MTKVSPPWERFEPGPGRRFTVPEVDNAPDLFGDVVDPDAEADPRTNRVMRL